MPEAPTPYPREMGTLVSETDVPNIIASEGNVRPSPGEVSDHPLQRYPADVETRMIEDENKEKNRISEKENKSCPVVYSDDELERVHALCEGLRSIGEYEAFRTARQENRLSDYDIHMLVICGALYSFEEPRSRSPKPAGWRTEMFDFMRFLKAHKSFAIYSHYLDRWDAWGDLGLYVDELGIDMEAFLQFFWGLDEVTAEDQFEYGWSMVKKPLGISETDRALASAIEDPLFPAFTKKGALILKNRFFNYAYHLGCLCGGIDDGLIILPVEYLSDMLRCSQGSISMYRASALREGFITEVIPYSQAKHKATRFSVDTDKMRIAAEKTTEQQAA